MHITHSYEIVHCTLHSSKISSLKEQNMIVYASKLVNGFEYTVMYNYKLRLQTISSTVNRMNNYLRKKCFKSSKHGGVLSATPPLISPLILHNERLTQKCLTFFGQQLQFHWNWRVGGFCTPRYFCAHLHMKCHWRIWKISTVSTLLKIFLLAHCEMNF